MTIYYLFGLGVLVYLLNGFKNLLSSFQFFKNESRLRDLNLNLGMTSNNFKIIILIPVLREQEVIATNLEIFSHLNGDYELIYITTEKENFEKKSGLSILESRKNSLLQIRSKDSFVETLVGIFPKSLASDLFEGKAQFLDIKKYWNYIVESYNNLPTTEKIITEYLQKNKFDNVQLINFPSENGVMAHQLNYACNQISLTHDPKQTFILVYNADSTVDKDILRVFVQAIQKGEKVMLQSSLFLSNYNTFSLNFRGWILKCIALAQSRWTFIHELARVRAQYKQNWHTIYESAHVVGHGTCIRLDTLMSVGGFPHKFVNEDFALGYFLALKGERIYSIPILENAESPTSISSVITQYTTWFYGVMDYFLYYKYAVNELSLNSFRALSYSIINSIRALMWLLAPWVWLGLIIIPLFFGRPLLSFFALLIFLFFTIFVYWLIANFVSKNPQVLGKEKFSIRIEKGMIFVAPIAYIIWGIGPTRSLMQKIWSRISGRALQKKKTER